MKLQGWKAHVYRTRGLSVGSSADSLDSMTWRTDEGYGDPTQPETDIVDLPVEHVLGDGQLFIRQSAPLPATILALSTEIEVDS